MHHHPIQIFLLQLSAKLDWQSVPLKEVRQMLNFYMVRMQNVYESFDDIEKNRLAGTN